ncbi:MAG: phytanoyl-CoA dioxygenase family protein [Caldilineaceae bacterium]|nr:phytanoyl-CoA dioxygenase family protein [Caldilineaceae bacterium]
MSAVAEKIFDYGTPDAYPADLYQYDGVASGVDDFASIGAHEIATFHEQGFLVVQNAFSTAEVDATLAGLLHLIGGGNPDFSGVMFEHAARDQPIDDMPAEQKQDFVRKFMWFVDFDERLSALAHHPALIDVVTRLMGESPVLFQDMALLKPPRIGREKPWHQDHAYFELPLETTVVGAWIALDPATVENGCMIVVPGSHRQGPVVHFKRRDWQICDTDVRNRGALAVPLRPGGCLLFHSLIHHGTPNNNSGLRRRAVQFHYRPVSAPKTSEEQRLAIFGEEGKGVTC